MSKILFPNPPDEYALFRARQSAGRVIQVLVMRLEANGAVFGGKLKTWYPKTIMDNRPFSTQAIAFLRTNSVWIPPVLLTD
jgi:hypothetical protein